MKVTFGAFLIGLSLTGWGRFEHVDLRARPVTQVSRETVLGKAPSLLPPGVSWRLVWHDEFDAPELDRTKWMCREGFWGEDFPAFAHDFKGVEMTGETMRLNLVRTGNDFSSPHLQTGSLVFDPPHDRGFGLWPFAPHRTPLFMHRYGYYEIRCRPPKHPGWHCAFWLQSPSTGATPDPARSGIETDIMENYAQHTRGMMVGGNIWGGYGAECRVFDHFEWPHEETPDGWHRYGCHWSPTGYTFWCDGKKIGEQNAPVSQTEAFVLVSTEPAGYRKVCTDGGLTEGRSRRVWGKPDERLFKIPLPDCFEVDYVRVYDEVPGVAQPVAEPSRVEQERAVARFVMSQGQTTGVVSAAVRAFDGWRRYANPKTGYYERVRIRSQLEADARKVLMSHDASVYAAAVLAATWSVTGDTVWRKEYWKVQEPALIGACRYGSMTEEAAGEVLTADKLAGLGAALGVVAAEALDSKDGAKSRSAIRTCRRYADAVHAAAFFGFVNAARETVSCVKRRMVWEAEACEIVCATNMPDVVRFAAEEAQSAMGAVLGVRPPIVSAPTVGKTSLVLGDTTWSRAAGIDTATLSRDAFVVSGEGSRMYVVGRDSPEGDLHRILENATFWQLYGIERGTLFGVYDFLERQFGVRFYFPGEEGTLTPHAKRVETVSGRYCVTPAFSVRAVTAEADGVPPNADGDVRSQNRWKALMWLRLRMETTKLPCSHGQCKFSLVRRFHRTHPEYFALLKRDGKTLMRDSEACRKGQKCVQLCQSSGIWDELFEDCKAYREGRSAESRGVRSMWNESKFAWNFSSRYVDVMPEDGMMACLCKGCQSSYRKERLQYASELIWGKTVALANRLAAVGSDAIVMQMAYPPYRDVPSVAIPSNVLVMVAETGPWGCAIPGKTDSEIADLRAWSEKLGHKVWMWTYPGKFGDKRCPGVPDMAPRAWSRYYQATKPFSTGAYAESESERAIFHYLNYYVFSRVAWEDEPDVEDILREHFALMFEAAAPEMAAFYAELEEKWMRGVLGRPHEGPFGPTVLAVDERTLWRDVYTKDVLNGWKDIFDRAEAKFVSQGDAWKRVRFMRRELLEGIIAARASFEEAQRGHTQPGVCK